MVNISWPPGNVPGGLNREEGGHTGFVQLAEVLHALVAQRVALVHAGDDRAAADL
jgi:hypothetical protein